MARKNRLISKIANSVTEDGTFSNEVLAADFSVRVDVYDSINALPIPVPQLGTQAFVPSAKRFYLSDGTGWYSVSAVNSTPVIQSITDSDGAAGPFTLDAFGSVTRVTLTVLDSDADPLSITFSKDTNFDGLGTITQNDNIFTITPLSVDSATTESGTVTFTVTDDVNITSSTQTFQLTFYQELTDATNITGTEQFINTAYTTASTYVHEKTNTLVLGNWSNSAIMFYELDGQSPQAGQADPTLLTSVSNFQANVHHQAYNDYLIASGWTTLGQTFDLSNKASIISSGTYSFSNTCRPDYSMVQFSEKYNLFAGGSGPNAMLYSLDPNANSPANVLNTTAQVSLNLSRNNMRSVAWDERGKFLIYANVDGYLHTVSINNLSSPSAMTEIAELYSGGALGSLTVSSIDATFRTAWIGNYNVNAVYYTTWNANGTINTFTLFNRIAAGGRDVRVASFTARDGILYLRTEETPTYLEIWDYRSGTPQLQSITNTSRTHSTIGANENTMYVYNKILWMASSYNTNNQTAKIF